MTLAEGLPLVIAVLGFAGIYLQTRRIHERTKEIEHSVNHVEEAPDSDNNGQVTLGQLVKQIDTKVDQGFESNLDAHHGFSEIQHSQGARLDAVRHDVDSLHSDFTGHIAAESDERHKIAAELAEKVDAVHEEVQTVNGHTVAALAEAAEGRRIEGDIPKGERTTDEQAQVDRLHGQGNPDPHHKK